MIIGFKEKFNFRHKIMSGSKIHTIRADVANRWKPGMTMHMATGNRFTGYRKFKEEKCKGVQFIEIINRDMVKRIVIGGMLKYHEMLDGFFGVSEEDKIWLQQFIRNDGFESADDFWAFFKGEFKGKLIHWTNLKY